MKRFTPRPVAEPVGRLNYDEWAAEKNKGVSKRKKTAELDAAKWLLEVKARKAGK